MPQVGYRIRGIEPADLIQFPESVRLMYWGWVVELGLKRKDQDLAAGLDKDGAPLRPLKPESIKHRKSQVGPTFRHARPLSPGQARSRVRSLLTGRAHTSSAEFWWKFDPITGRSFADVLLAQQEQGRDVFGLSPAGTSWVRSEAAKRWQAWTARAGFAGPPAAKPGRQVAKQAPGRRPVQQIALRGRTDLANADLGPGADLARTQRAIAAGQHTGFRRLNAEGEKWVPPPPGTSAGNGKLPVAPTTAQRQSVERALAVPFRMNPAAAAERQSVILIDVGAIEDEWARRQPAQYIGTGGRVRDPAAYQQFTRRLLELRATGKPVTMPQLELDANDDLVIAEGAARLAVFRDQGALVLPVSVPRDQAVDFRRRFGATLALLRHVAAALRRTGA